MADGRIRIKQIESGEFRSLISGVSAEGYIPYVAAALQNVYASSDTGTFAVFNISLSSGSTGYGIGFSENFNGVPTVIPSLLCPTGRPFINAYATTANRSGCNIAFSSGTPVSGYRLQVIAIDTFLVTSGIASILNASDAGLDLITAPTVALQRQILGVQAIIEKNRALGYAGLNSNAQIDTGLLPSEYLNWDGGSIGGSTRKIQYKRAARATLLTYIPAVGEPVYAIDTKVAYIGDGVTAGGNTLGGGGGGGGDVDLTYVMMITGDQNIQGLKNFTQDLRVGDPGNELFGIFRATSADGLFTTFYPFEESPSFTSDGKLYNDTFEVVLDARTRTLTGGLWTFNVDGGGF